MSQSKELSIQLKAFNKFGKDMARAMKQVADNFRRTMKRIRPVVRYALRRQVAALDPFIMTDDWISPACTGWLCDSCPQVDLPGIQCAHKCHGGHIR